MNDKKETLFLVHQETGQRYPLKGEITLGRQAGDLIFTRDPRLSQQHCRITPTERGVILVDLNSANGTFVNGQRIPPQRPTAVRPGTQIAAGEQILTLQTVSVKTNVRRRKKKRKAQPAPVLSYVLTGILLLVAGLALRPFLLKEVRTNALAHEVQIPRELAEIFDDYGGLRTSLDQDLLSPKDAAARIQGRTLLRLRGLRARLASQHAESDRDKRLLDLQVSYAEILTNHAEIEVQALTSGDSKAQDLLDEQEDRLNQIVINYREQLDPRRPASQALPNFIQSPLQIVEREFRRALRDYKNLGAQVHDQKINDAQMAMAIRNDLLPKLNAVFSRMGALQPETKSEQLRLQYEQKMVSAYLGQLKSMALYAETKDVKYNADVDRWTSLIEKIKGDFKKPAPGPPPAPSAPAG